jgi:hypothetical protein
VHQPNMSIIWLNFVHMTRYVSLDSDCMLQITVVSRRPPTTLIGDGLVTLLPINIFSIRIIRGALGFASFPKTCRHHLKGFRCL